MIDKLSVLNYNELIASFVVKTKVKVLKFSLLASISFSFSFANHYCVYINNH